MSQYNPNAPGWQPAGFGAISDPDSPLYVDFNNPAFRNRTYSNEPGDQNYHPYADLVNQMMRGQAPTGGWRERFAGMTGGDSQQVQLGPDGKPLEGTFAEHGNNDQGFWNGALIAGAVTGANIGAASSAGASSQGLSSADKAALYGDAGYGSLPEAYAGSGEFTAGIGGSAPATTTGPMTQAGTNTSGAWNGTDFGGRAATGAGSMGFSDWINLGQLALGAYGVSQASGAASDATAAASGVAQGQLNLSQQALDWAKQIYAEQAPDRKATQDRANAISDAQLEAMKFATGQAQDLDAYNKATFRPLEQKFVADAATFDTPERRMAAAASAAADVDSSVAAARGAAERNLARSGIAPGSAKALALAEDSAVAQGRARGGAMTAAARNVEQQGYARTADAIGLGRGLAPTQATQQQIATTTGNSSTSNSTAGLNAAMAGNSGVQQGYTQAINGMGSAGALFNSVASSQRQDDAQLLQGISGIGQFMGRTYGTSDKGKKSGTGRMADTAKALREVEKTRVNEGWKFDPAKGGPDDGGEPHIGPMAQEVNRVSGEKAAPGGQVIDLMDRMGRMEAAMQQISKNVKALAREDATEKEAA